MEREKYITVIEETTIETIDMTTAPLYTITDDVFLNDERRKFQLNDEPTALHFLKKYQPEYVITEEISPYFRKIPPTDIAHMLPERIWFRTATTEYALRKNLSHADTIHGVAHSLRVGMYAYVLAQMEGLDNKQTDILLAAAMIHDTYREDDTIDMDHGKRAADGWRESMDILQEKGIYLDGEAKETVSLLCTYHEKKWEDVGNEVTEAQRKLLRLFMVADALDRFRSPHEKWWPDISYFTDDAHTQFLMKKLLPFAMYITLQTEYYRLRYGVSPQEACTAVGKDVGFFGN